MSTLISKNRSMDEILEKKIKNHIKKNENEFFSEFASKSQDGIRKKKEQHKEDIRCKYSRDADRIMHTHAYSRYIDKTQVFYLIDNDHLTHRVLHVQYVSKIAKTIGRALCLNEDLIEAISIGHDIGHVPFGHFGEKILSDICKKEKIGKFLHNVQGIQFLDKIESCKLTLQVLDGILCHNGEIPPTKKLEPNRYKDWEYFYTEIEKIKNNFDDYVPMTLEGCVVRFADIIAYVGRDLQDAKEICVINDNLDIPVDCQEKIGTKNSEIINTLTIDVIENSFDNDYISYSGDISKCLEEYMAFSADKIYNNTKIKTEDNKIKFMYNHLFEKFKNDLYNNDKESKIFKDFINLEWIEKEYIDESTNEEKVRDYIAGMTDRYFNSTFEEIVIPKRRSCFCDE